MIMHTYDYPRILVVSNNGFSDTSNNGRTLGNLFVSWPKSKIAQFCISIGIPNYNICDNYYIITDKEALKAFLHFRKANKCNINDVINSEGNTSIIKNRAIKTGTKALLRHWVWSNDRWKNSEFIQWINDFNPQIVLCYNSDSAFILNIARSISEGKKIPLIMFNTEGYYLFKKSFYRAESFIDKIAFPLYRFLYKKTYRRFMKEVSCVIYLNEKLEQDYKHEFSHRSDVIHTSSSLYFDENSFNQDNYLFTYLGNFGYNRWEALIEVADVLNSLNSEYKLDIYGKATTEIEQQFLKCPNIRYHGYISYQAVTEIMYSSTILFHVETQDCIYAEGLKYGFTTKIADSISSGHCFVMCSSSDVAGAKYVRDSGAGWFAETKEELSNVISCILNNSLERERVLKNARYIASKNHNIEINHKKFISIINDIVHSYNYK